MNTKEWILNPKNGYRGWIAIGLTNLVCLPLLLMTIYLFQDYSIATFIFLPLLIGLISSSIWSYQRDTTLKQATVIAYYSGLFLILFLLLFAIEGVICILMISPLAVLFIFLGALTGFYLTNANGSHSALGVLLVVGLIPLSAFHSKTIAPEVVPVTSSVIIEADKELVWNTVVAFPPLDPPKEWLFRLGILIPHFFYYFKDQEKARSDTADSIPAILLNPSLRGRRMNCWRLTFFHNLSR